MDDGAITAAVATAIAAEATGLAILQRGLTTQATMLATVCRLLAERAGEGRPGRVVCSGVGKAGIIARKIAATLASTGTPALFVHPTEARHGDLGMVASDDVALLLSNSGASEELVSLVADLRRIGCTVVALVGSTASPLGRISDHAIAIGRIAEACPLGLAPSASTTALLALGDGLALAVQQLRRFTPEQYARFHPAGALGRKLMTCAEAMRPRARIAVVSPATAVSDCLRAITSARTGSVLLADDHDHLLGIFTDGDLRRVLSAATDPAAALHSPVRDHATVPCLSITGARLVEEALHRCAAKKINELPVIDDAGTILGLIDIQDLAARGFAL